MIDLDLPPLFDPVTMLVQLAEFVEAGLLRLFKNGKQMGNVRHPAGAKNSERVLKLLKNELKSWKQS